MPNYLIICGLCLVVLLQVVGTVWQKALEIHRAATDDFERAHDFTEQGQQTINDCVGNASRKGRPESSRPKYCQCL
jgi:hypothetical protein